jgi:type IV pilus assembly protein PilB
MQIDEGQLGVFLVDSGLLTRSQFEDARRAAGGSPLYSFLSQRNLIPEDELRRAAAHASGTSFVVLTRDDISPLAVVLIPEPVARLHNMIAYKLEDGALEVALLDLDDLEHLKPLDLGLKIRPRLTSRSSIKQGLIYYQKILKEKFGAMLSSGTQVVDALIHHALFSRASGVHIDLSTTSTLVRYRIGQSLREAFELPDHIGRSLAERLKALAKLLPTSSTVQEGRFKFEKNGERHTVHISALPTSQGERVMLKLARESSGMSGFALDSLGLHGENLERAHKLLACPSGLILVASPAGGGKTTTLYTLIDQLNHGGAAISTIEEGIGFHFPHVAQTKVRPEVGVTVLAGLRALLKQDPDIAAVDQVRDADTAALAASAANRGALVIAAIEASSAGEAIERMLKLGVSPRLLASTLKGVIATQVVKRICSHERDEYRLARAEGAPLEPFANFGRVLAALKEEGIVEDATQWKELLFARAVPCSKCQNGYAGVSGLQEALLTSSIIKEMIGEGASGGALEAQAHEEGMPTLVEDGLFKAAAGITSIEEVFRVVQG